MRNFLLILNGKAIADFRRLAAARKRYHNLCKQYDPEENTIDLVNIATGELVNSNFDE